MLDALRQTFAPVRLFAKKPKGSEVTFKISIGDWRIIYELHPILSKLTRPPATRRLQAY